MVSISCIIESLTKKGVTAMAEEEKRPGLSEGFPQPEAGYNDRDAGVTVEY